MQNKEIFYLIGFSKWQTRVELEMDGNSAVLMVSNKSGYNVEKTP